MGEDRQPDRRHFKGILVWDGVNTITEVRAVAPNYLKYSENGKYMELWGLLPNSEFPHLRNLWRADKVLVLVPVVTERECEKA